jgi:small subunit ribosomal protein S20
LRSFQETLDSGDAEAINDRLKKAHHALDKAADKGIIHRNNASRRKSRLAMAANRQLAGNAQVN